VRFAEAQRPQRGGVGLPRGAVHLVGRQHHRLARAPQHPHHLGVGLGHTHRAVHDEQDRIGQLHRDLGLFRDARVDARDVHLPAAGVHDGEVPAGPLGGVRHAVTRHPGGVEDHGLPPAKDPVDQRRLAHVGSPHDGQHRQARSPDGAARLLRAALEERLILLRQLELGQPRAEGRRAAVGLDVVDVERLGVRDRCV